MRRISILVVMVCLLSSFSYAKAGGLRGFDLYHNLSADPDSMTEEQVIELLKSLGYIDGFLDGISIMQDSYFKMLFPPLARENDLKTKKAKEINFKKIGIPKSGISIGQLQLIFEKWAKEHPEDLNQTARLCLLLSLIDAYGWAYP